jgi:hypothetical protein
MTPGTEKVLQLFSDRAFLISQLARSNPAFLSLCEEFDLAVDALQQLESRPSQGPADLMRVAEYRALVEELKVDLLRRLQAAEASARQ